MRFEQIFEGPQKTRKVLSCCNNVCFFMQAGHVVDDDVEEEELEFSDDEKVQCLPLFHICSLA